MTYAKLLASIFLISCFVARSSTGFLVNPLAAPLAANLCHAKSLPKLIHIDHHAHVVEHLHTPRLSETSLQRESKRKMLLFALPTLGIFLMNPLLSNIDNIFVGKTVGTPGLAALSPATIWTDQMLYAFGFLGQATTSLVSRAYAADAEGHGNTTAACQAVQAPLTMALILGSILTVVYALATPWMVRKVQDPIVQVAAASYIQWRGSIVWAALSQRVLLSMQLATRDAVTPLKIVGLAAMVNILADALLCVYPFRWGCAGAAAATAFATLFSSTVMVRSLQSKHLLPTRLHKMIRLPTPPQLLQLFAFAGPVMAVTMTRISGSVAMQKAAMKLGVKPMAAYQLALGLLYFFLLFASPLNQLAQTRLPALMEQCQSNNKNSPINDSEAPRQLLWATFQSILSLAATTALAIGACAGMACGFGSTIFTSDPAVQVLARGAAPAVFVTVAIGVFTVAIDGAMLAARDFGFMLWQGIVSLLLQIALLKSSSFCTSLSAVFATFALRLGFYSAVGLIRIALGYGRLGRVLRQYRLSKENIYTQSTAIPSPAAG